MTTAFAPLSANAAATNLEGSFVSETEQTEQIKEVEKAFETLNVTYDGLQSYAEEIGIDINSTEVSITDAQMEQLFEYMGVKLPPVNDAADDKPTMGLFSNRINGVTKIINHGSGNIDLYLSGTFIKRYYQGGALVGTALTAILATMSAGLLLPVAATVTTALAGMVAGEVEYGKIVYIRGWSIQSIVDQRA